MRALLRVDIIAAAKFPPKSDRQAYDAALIRLFTDIGYTPRSPDDLGVPDAASPQSHQSSGRLGAEPIGNRAATPSTTIGDAGPGSTFDWHTNQNRLAASEVVAHVFEDFPPRIAHKEKAHLIMAGYTSDGQMDFVVCAVNERALHIRARQRFVLL